jgi:hypothetical protein
MEPIHLKAKPPVYTRSQNVADGGYGEQHRNRSYCTDHHGSQQGFGLRRQQSCRQKRRAEQTTKFYQITFKHLTDPVST